MSAILEMLTSEAGQKTLSENSDKIEMMDAMVSQFNDVLKGFVMEHMVEFMGRDIQETYKNISVFSEVANAHFMNEISAMFANTMVETEIKAQQALNRYL